MCHRSIRQLARHCRQCFQVTLFPYQFVGIFGPFLLQVLPFYSALNRVVCRLLALKILNLGDVYFLFVGVVSLSSDLV